MFNSIEKLKNPEYEKHREFFNAISSLEPEDYMTFDFDGLTHFLFLEEDFNEPFFSKSSEVSGYDIYLGKQLNKEEQRRIIFHELCEASILEDISGGNEDDSIPREEINKKASEDAHKKAQAIEEYFFGKRK